MGLWGWDWSLVWGAGGAFGTTFLAGFGAWSIYDLRRQRDLERLRSKPLFSVYRRWESTFSYFVLVNTGAKTLLINEVHARGGSDTRQKARRVDELIAKQRRADANLPFLSVLSPGAESYLCPDESEKWRVLGMLLDTDLSVEVLIQVSTAGSETETEIVSIILDRVSPVPCQLSETAV